MKAKKKTKIKIEQSELKKIIFIYYYILFIHILIIND